VNDPGLLKDYFTKLGQIIRAHKLQACLMFTMDEKGFLMVLSTQAKVLCRRGCRNPHVTHDGKRELVTVIETVLASGAALSPFVINKCKGHYLGWHRNLTDKERSYRFSYSPKGWTANQLALEWLKDLFDPESGIMAGIREPRLLIFDGHGSHITFSFIQFCIDHDIHLLCLPSHSTHLLQPLDMGLFSPYQHFYGLAVDKHLRSGQSLEGIKKAVFIPFLTEARDNTMRPVTIQSVFTSSGIWPLNPRRVLRKVAPESPKRRYTLGLVKNPRNAQDIRNRVKMG